LEIGLMPEERRAKLCTMKIVVRTVCSS